MSTSYVKYNGVTIGKGNAKLSKKIAIFNLPAGKISENGYGTCSVTCPGCYAIKAQVQYPSCLTCRENNYKASLKNDFVKNFNVALKMSKCQVVRFHESGDIYSLAYSEKIEDICNSNPEVKFYLYTKSNFRPYAKNLNIVNSYLPNGEVNFGNIDYVTNNSKWFSIPVCPVTLKVAGAKCGDTCTMCQRKSNMLFVIH